MSELKVQQRSYAWYEARKSVLLTASQFGDALGVGKGKVSDFLLSLVSDDPCYEAEPNNPVLQHGVKTEAVIREAYQLLTGNGTRESGFWIPLEMDEMRGIIGVTPDDIVVSQQSQTTGPEETILGLVEYKAPVYKLYKQNYSTVSGIPRHYMAQIQGQMAVTRTPWCDFMAVCMRTREIMLQRVFFSPLYWKYISAELKKFTAALHSIQILKQNGSACSDFCVGNGINRFVSDTFDISVENTITVKNLLNIATSGRYCGPSKKWLTFDVLVGSDIILSPSLQSYADALLKEVDEDIELASMV